MTHCSQDIPNCRDGRDMAGQGRLPYKNDRRGQRREMSPHKSFGSVISNGHRSTQTSSNSLPNLGNRVCDFSGFSFMDNKTPIQQSLSSVQQLRLAVNDTTSPEAKVGQDRLEDLGKVDELG